MKPFWVDAFSTEERADWQQKFWFCRIIILFFFLPPLAHIIAKRTASYVSVVHWREMTSLAKRRIEKRLYTCIGGRENFCRRWCVLVSIQSACCTTARESTQTQRYSVKRVAILRLGRGNHLSLSWNAQTLFCWCSAFHLRHKSVRSPCLFVSSYQNIYNIMRPRNIYLYYSNNTLTHHCKTLYCNTEWVNGKFFFSRILQYFTITWVHIQIFCHSLQL